jgi:hypothetical protein
MIIAASAILFIIDTDLVAIRTNVATSSAVPPNALPCAILLLEKNENRAHMIDQTVGVHMNTGMKKQFTYLLLSLLRGFLS